MYVCKAKKVMLEQKLEQDSLIVIQLGGFLILHTFSKPDSHESKTLVQKLFMKFLVRDPNFFRHKDQQPYKIRHNASTYSFYQYVAPVYLWSLKMHNYTSSKYSAQLTLCSDTHQMPRSYHLEIATL